MGIAIAVGVVRGKLTLLQATAVTDRWGTTHYGRLSGVLAAPATIASALAPFAGAALAGPLGGCPGLFIVLALTSAAGALFAAGGTPPGAHEPGRQGVHEPLTSGGAVIERSALTSPGHRVCRRSVRLQPGSRTASRSPTASTANGPPDPPHGGLDMPVPKPCP